MSEIARIFATDPLRLTREDISTIVDAMRQKREAFNLGMVKAGSMKPKTEKQEKTEELLKNLDIEL